MTAPLTLYAIGDQYEAVRDQIVEAGGELTPEIEAALDAIDDAFTDKVERVALYIRNLTATKEAVLNEVRRLQSIAQTHENAAKSLKAYLMANMVRTDKRKVETPLARVRIQKNSRPAIRWPDGLPPEPYQRVTIDLDGKQAYDDWRAGTLPEGFVVEQGEHLRIS